MVILCSLYSFTDCSETYPKLNQFGELIDFSSGDYLNPESRRFKMNTATIKLSAWDSFLSDVYSLMDNKSMFKLQWTVVDLAIIGYLIFN